MSGIIMIQESFSYVVKAVNSINNDQDLNLTPHRPRRPQRAQDEMAVWSVDDLFIKATATGEQLCELEAINVRQNPKGISKDARDAWDELVKALRKKLPERVKYSSDSERLARKTLGQVPPSEDKDHEEWQEKQESAAQISREEAVQKLFNEEKALHGAASDGGDGREQEKDNEETPKPWESIPDISWHRMAVRLLWQGYPDKEIGRKVGVAGKTVANMLSELRQQFPELVPKRDELGRLKRENRE